MGDLSLWTGCEAPARAGRAGRFVTLEPLDAQAHGPAMFDAHRSGDPDGELWAYLPYGPFKELPAYLSHLKAQSRSSDPLFFTVCDNASGDAVGLLSLLNIQPGHGVAEVGHIIHTPRLRRTPGSTEAVLLLGRYLFEELGYRRYEWKCNNANAASKAAAVRFGFQPEGMFRNHMVVKGANRDTAWFGMTDGDWPAIGRAMDTWLSPDNFDADGQQRQTFAALRAAMA